LGYLPEGAPSYGEMKVREFLLFVARVRGKGGIARSRRMDEIIALLQLEPVLERTIETLSKGFRRRVCLAQALLHDPPALILDEPTDGLDPNQQSEVHALIRDMARDRAIILCTHALNEVSTVCNRVAILADGRLRAQGTPAELEAQSRYHGAVSFHAPASARVRISSARSSACWTRKASRSTNCNWNAAGWTKYSAASPGMSHRRRRHERTRRDPCAGQSAPAARRVRRRAAARVAQLSDHAGRVVVHGDFPAAGRCVDVLPRRPVRTRAGRPAAVLPVSSVAVPGAGARAGDATVGGGTPQRYAGIAVDLADPPVGSGACEILRGLDLRRRGARIDLPDVADDRLPRQPGQRRDPRGLSRQP